MKQIDLDRTIIEATVERALSEIRADPERTLRRLVDMGQGFANGPFQRHFFEAAQHMLENESSAYYQLLKRIVTEVNHEKLKTFGMNLGYNGCTKGAKLIRSHEAKLGFNIPWALSFALAKEDCSLTIEELTHAIHQGKELGIYVYFLFYQDDRLMDTQGLLAEHNDCAFILFSQPEFLTAAAIHSLEKQNNIMVSITADLPETEPITRTLRAQHFLFSVHSFYTALDVKTCLNAAHMEKIPSYGPLFYFLIPAESCPKQDMLEMGPQVSTVRDAQRYPLLPVDMLHDMLHIDRIISEDACAVSFDSTGHARDCYGQRRHEKISLRNMSLSDILRISNPKAI